MKQGAGSLPRPHPPHSSAGDSDSAVLRGSPGICPPNKLPADVEAAPVGNRTRRAAAVASLPSHYCLLQSSFCRVNGTNPPQTRKSHDNSEHDSVQPVSCSVRLLVYPDASLGQTDKPFLGSCLLSSPLPPLEGSPSYLPACARYFINSSVLVH